MTKKAGHLRTLAAPETESEVTDREFVERYVRRPDEAASLRCYTVTGVWKEVGSLVSGLAASLGRKR